MQPLLKKRFYQSLGLAGWLWVFFGCFLPIAFGGYFLDVVSIVVGLTNCLIILVAYVWGRLNVLGVIMGVDLPARIHSGKSTELTLYLKNSKYLLSSYSMKTEIALLHGVRLEAEAPLVSTRDKTVCKRRFIIQRRGVMFSANIKLESSFPLGLFRFEIFDQLSAPTIVYPRKIVPVELLAMGEEFDFEPKSGVSRGEMHGEFRGVRVWQPGDPLKRVHWQSSSRTLAQGQGLRVREYDPPGFSPKNAVVLFHSFAASGEVYRMDRFERAISLAAGTLDYFCSRKIDLLFTADFLGWRAMNCNTRAEHVELLAILAEALRSLGTEREVLQGVVDQYASSADQVVIISDIDPIAFSEKLKLPRNVIVIDIRQIKYSRRRFSKAS